MSARTRADPIQIGAPGEENREIEQDDPGEQTQGQTEGEASAPASASDWIAYPALHDDRLVKWGADSDIGISSGLERTLSFRV